MPTVSYRMLEDDRVAGPALALRALVQGDVVQSSLGDAHDVGLSGSMTSVFQDAPVTAPCSHVHEASPVSATRVFGMV